MFNNYSIEIGDSLWSALHAYLSKTFPDGEDSYCSKYYIDSIWEDGEQKFAILQSRDSSKMYRLNFYYTETGFASDGELVEVEKTYIPVNRTSFSLKDFDEYEKNNLNLSDKNGEEGDNNSDNKSEGLNTENQPEDVPDEPEIQIEEPVATQYILEEIPEYVELMNKYSALEADFNTLNSNYEKLNEEIEPLREFKVASEKKEKQAMIDSFYMLSDEDKSDVIANIDTYSIDDIEAKLSIICVRNRVNFNLEDEKTETVSNTTYSLNNSETDMTPAWIKALDNVAKSMN